MKAMRKILFAVATAGLVVAGTVAAQAEWLVPVSVSVKTRAVKMPQGVTPSVAKDGKAAIVSWSTQEIAQGADMTAYVITAHSLNNPPLPTRVHEVTGKSKNAQSEKFKAAEVAGGRWKWTVTPKFRSWIGDESVRSEPLEFGGVPAAVDPAAAALVADAPDSAATPAPAAAPPTTPTEAATSKPAATATSTSTSTAPPPPVEKDDEPPPAEGAPSPPGVQPTPGGADAPTP